MTYKTRQEVLRAAADWIDVCEKAGIAAMCKYDGYVYPIEQCSLGKRYSGYEFPIALLEGKEVWVGSELYDKEDGIKVVAHIGINMNGTINRYSWNPPKPATVMVEMHTSDAENIVRFAEVMHITLGGSEIKVIADACKKALEKL